MKTRATKQPSTESSRAKRPAHAPKMRTHSAHQAPIGKRKAGCACGGGCPRCQENELSLQTKLKIGQPGDKYEQEADRVADQVVRIPEPTVQRQVEQEEDEGLIQTKPLITPLVQRQVEEEEDEGPLQAKEHPGQTPTVTPSLASRRKSLRGGGQPLPESVRSFFEPRFGRDFGQVRVHTGAQAASDARAVNARAFTVGRDVVFGAGQYAPETGAGRRLLAHELTHVVQQGSQDHSNSSPSSPAVSRWPAPPSIQASSEASSEAARSTLPPTRYRVRVVGHASPRWHHPRASTPERRNLALSERRARAIPTLLGIAFGTWHCLLPPLFARVTNPEI